MNITMLDRRIEQRIRRLTKKAKIAAYKRAYYQRHRAEIAAYQRAYYQRHRGEQ